MSLQNSSAIETSTHKQDSNGTNLFPPAADSGKPPNVISKKPQSSLPVSHSTRATSVDSGMKSTQESIYPSETTLTLPQEVNEILKKKDTSALLLLPKNSSMSTNSTRTALHNARSLCSSPQRENYLRSLDPLPTFSTSMNPKKKNRNEQDDTFVTCPLCSFSGSDKEAILKHMTEIH